ncbi:MarR family winged helix-turn-helix transcriptional regulator [Microbispora sp. NPDC049125]|uniref:MarR family winged helix-turn-helix transcriptional regulator n=1 Tax=Microbispora sp. NPDC049125 TaxID=3154929 RepID=UPI0034677EE9
MSTAFRPLTPDEEMVVRAFARVMHVLPRAIDADIQREGDLPLVGYTVLTRLSEAPGRHMRMTDLAAACEVSLSGMTRIVTRLEAQGLVDRVACDEDARGLNAFLTDAGLARLEQARPAHLASVRRHILDQLEGVDLVQLAGALQRFATADCPSAR